MDFDDYERHRHPDFCDFADTVAAILKASIGADRAYRMQQIQARGKDPASLKVKLEKNDAIASSAIEDVIKDLAGCRVIFYTNADVNRFLSSDILRRNFVIDPGRTKVHHPVPDSDTETQLFQSDNIVVKLNDLRAALPEYARYRGMRCEIQVQTTLNHAWSEMEHDLYKLKPVAGFGKALHGQIEARFNKVMREHLVPAGYEFQKIVDDYHRLAKGRALYDEGHLHVLASCADNNERCDALERIKAYVLPSLDEPAHTHRELCEALVACVERARATPMQPICFPGADLPGRSSEDVTELCADILDQLRYASLDAIDTTLDSLCALYAGAVSDEERTRIQESVGKLAAYNVDAWKAAGLIVQDKLVRRIHAWDAETLDALRPIALTVLEQALKPEASGTSSTYKTIKLHRAALVSSEELARLRAMSLNVLESLFRSAHNDTERRIVRQALLEATHPPQRPTVDSALHTTVLENAARVVRFFREQASGLSHELVRTLENDVLWQVRWARRSPDAPAEAAEVTRARAALDAAAFEFRDVVNANRDYVIHKTLVGFDSVFSPQWNGDFRSVKAEESHRAGLIDQLVNEVTDANADEWLVILQRCAGTDSIDGATFLPLGKFLEAFARRQPDIAVSYLDRLGDDLARFLRNLLQGLAQTPQWPDAKQRIDHWVAEGKYLLPILWYYQFADEVDVSLIEQALPLAIEAADDRTVWTIAEICAARADVFPSGVATALFMRIVEYAQSKNNAKWVDWIWAHLPKGSLIPSLTEPQIDRLLAALVAVPKVDHHAEYVLTAVAKRFPNNIVDFFGERMRFSESDAVTDHYEAIPYRFAHLSKHLEPAGAHLLEQSQRWHQEQQAFFEFRGGRLLSLVFPKFTPSLEALLTDVLASGRDGVADYIADVLHGYQGALATHELYRKLVDAVPEDADVLSVIDAGLIFSVGVVHGEFGMREAFQHRKIGLQSWLTDARPRVRAYAAARDHMLDGMIATEQRQSEQELEARKRHYGDDDDDDNE